MDVPGTGEHILTRADLQEACSSELVTHKSDFDHWKTCIVAQSQCVAGTSIRHHHEGFLLDPRLAQDG